MHDIIQETGMIVEKSVIAAVVLFILARCMGKKQIAQLSFFDYVVGISIGSIAAAMSVDQQISVHAGIISMIIWAILPIVFSHLSIHSRVARRWLDGIPLILIENGKIIERNLKKSKFTVNDLLEELRLKDVFDMSDVDFAILETNGKLSVLKKASKQPATSEELNLPAKSQGIFANIIIDGKLMKENLTQMNLNEAWLCNELKKNNIHSYSEVLLAMGSFSGILRVDRKHNDPKHLNIFQ